MSTPERDSADPQAPPSADLSQPSADAGEASDAPKPPDRHECRSCGYVYEPANGDGRAKIAPGTPFEELPPTWRCPVCGAKIVQFDNIGPAGKASGFEENLGFGLGVNTLTPGAKNLLIFLGLATAFAFMISLYGLR